MLVAGLVVGLEVEALVEPSLPVDRIPSWAGQVVQVLVVALIE